MSSLQVWTLIGVFSAAIFSMQTFGMTWFTRVLRTEMGRLDARIDGLGERLDGRIDGLRGEMNARFDAVDARFDAVDTRIDYLDRDVQALTRRVLGTD